MNEITSLFLALAAIFVPLGLVWAMVEWQCRNQPWRKQKKRQ
ncbi:MAG: hypothetical protein WC540_01900 [Sulfuritalea sp.]